MLLSKGALNTFLVYTQEKLVWNLCVNTVYKSGESMEEYLGRIRPIAERLGYDNALMLYK